MAERNVGIEVDVKATGKGDLVKLRQEMQRVETSIDELRAAIKQSEAAFESAQKETSQLKQEYKELERSGEKTADAFDELSRKIQDSEQAERELSDQTERLVADFKKLDAEAGQADSALDKLGDEAESVGSELVGMGRDAQKVEGSVDDLRAAIKQSERTFEDARSASINLKREYTRLDESGEGTREMFEGLSRQIERTQASELDAISATRKLVTEFNDLEGETDELAGKFGDLGKRLNEAEGWITGVTPKVRKMEDGFNKLGDEVQDTGRKMDAVGGEVQQVGNKVEKMGKDARRAADGIDELGDTSKRSAKGIDKLQKSGVKFSAIGNIISDVMQDAVRAVVEFAKESVQAFHDFDRSSREVFTLIPGASAEMREALTRDALALGTELGRLPDEVLPAIYNALSAGIPEDNVLNTVKIASDAARAGVADLESTMKLGLGILNAQVGGVSDLSDVYDQLFFIVKNGVVTLPELNTVMSQVTSVAGEAGVSMQDISAAMIVMTRQGDSAAEAAELLSTMLTQLSTSGTTLADVFEQASGTSFRKFTDAGGTLAEAMQLLQRHSEQTGIALGDMLGGGSPFFRDTQAARGALELTGKHLESLIAFSKEAEGQFGAMGAASAEMGEAAELGALKAASAWEEMKIAVGESLTEETNLFLRSKVAIAEHIAEQARQATQLSKTTEAFRELGYEGVSLQKRIDAVTQGTVTFTAAMVDAETMALRSEIAMKLLAAGFEGGSNELEQLIAEEIKQIAVQKELVAAAVEVGNSLVETDEKMMRLADGYAILAEAQAEINKNERLFIDARDMRLDAIGAEIQADKERVYAYLENNKEINAAAEEAAAKAAVIAAAIAEDRTVRIAAAAEMEQAALLASQQVYNSTALSILNSAEAETNFVDALFQTSAQAGINQGQFLELAEASGEYSEAQIRAALTEAAMKQAVEELSGQLAAGTITVGDAVASLQNFEAALAGDFTATLEYGDFTNAEAQARATKDALLAAEGDYSANFTQTNTTINEIITKYSSTGEPVGQAMYSGGSFGAGDFLIVGDGPGGEILPTTELVVFDRPGQVVSGAETNKILSEQGPPVAFDMNGGSVPSIAGNGEAAGSTDNSRTVINFHIYESSRSAVSEITAALQQEGLIS